jgi:molybdopterin synthase catalytic subunit|tara:strand:+ start:781 stop:1248 length:468 start_codon:yes stop_codon:yes gene_type:complete
MAIYIQKELFDISELTSNLVKDNTSIGAVVSFVGYVRDYDDTLTSKKLIQMNLEHYPGMTEKALTKIEVNAKSRWSLQSVCIVHRIGKLLPSDPIVAVIVASQHRKKAFQACEYIIDFLKTDAPFWKKEISSEDEIWVKVRDEDHKRKSSWNLEK